MTRKKLTQDKLRAEILSEAEKAGLEDMPRNIKFFGVEEGDGWTISFDGPLMFSPDAKRLGAILARLAELYDVEWHTRH